MIISAAKDYDCALRIGVNAGSLEKDILEKYKDLVLKLCRKRNEEYKAY